MKVLEKYKAANEFSQKGIIMHKFYLLNEYSDKGFRIAIQNKDEIDVEFLISINGRNTEEIKNQLISELKQL